MNEVTSRTCAFYRLGFPLWERPTLNEPEQGVVLGILRTYTGLNVEYSVKNQWANWEFPCPVSEKVMRICNEKIMQAFPEYDFIWRCTEVTTTIRKNLHYSQLIAKENEQRKNCHLS